MRLTREQSEALIKRYRPGRTRLRWKRKTPRRFESHCRRLVFDHYEILAPYPDTIHHALLFLHECAHIANGDWRLEPDEHVFEYMAERTAMCWLRAEGYAVPHRVVEVRRWYVRACIRADRKRGIRIKPHIAKWARAR